MGDLVAQEVAKSKRSSGIEASRARQAHYIEWCTSKNIKDPVGLEEGWQVVVAIYTKCVVTGVNYLNKETLRSATCGGYAIDASRLFSLRKFPNPVDFLDETNWTKTLTDNLEREENVACQRNPLNDMIHAEVINTANMTGPCYLEAAVADITSNGKILGCRASEHSHTSPDKVDYHEHTLAKIES